MCKMEQMSFWLGADRCSVPEGELRLLSAREVLEARRESELLAADGRERALCANACLIAKALGRGGKPVYANGWEVLSNLRVEDIVRLSDRWAQFNREHNPSPCDSYEETQRRKKAWSTRIMSAFSGACSAHLALCLRRSGPGR